MKIIAESPEEDCLLKEMEQVLHDKGFHNVYTETFDVAFLGQVLSGSLSKLYHEPLQSWTPQQRLWFYKGIEEFSQGTAFRAFAKEYEAFVSIYENIFQEENKAFHSAVKDFSCFLDIKKNCELLGVDNYKKLSKFLAQATRKGKNEKIKTICAYYDEAFSQYVIELNSIKVPFCYRNGIIEEGVFVYGWSDTNFRHSYEFLKPELVLEIDKISKKNGYEINEKKVFQEQIIPLESDSISHEKRKAMYSEIER